MNEEFLDLSPTGPLFLVWRNFFCVALKVVLPLLLLWCFPLLADQIVLRNGDRLSGTIEKSDDKELVIKTELAGEVTVQWPAIQEIRQSNHFMLV